ncbi:MAG: glycosyltransferase family 4 protein [Thermoleophilia bacterium]
MARIGIDAHAIGEKLTGNETYVSNLVEALIELDMSHELVLFFTKPDARETWQQSHAGLETVLVRLEQPLVRIPLLTPWLVWRQAIDLLHVQYVGPPLMTAPLVAVIHDISFESFPQFFSRKEVIQFRHTIPLTARRARKVLTVSENSKRDLVDIYGLPEDKVIVTYLGVNDRFRPVSAGVETRQVTDRYGISNGYILAVGNLQPRKNLVRLMAAYTRLRSARPDIEQQLVIVGKKAWKHDPILAFVEKSPWNRDIILTDYVPDDDLPALYSGASMMVYPSLYEGFGLPPLESMACGTPVIVSDRASLPEVVGDAGIKVNPYDVDALAAAMASLALDEATRHWFSEAGIRQAQSFTWDRTARETAAVYENVLREESF